MSELNLALQAIGLMREKVGTASLEKVLESCNFMKDIRTAAKTHSTLKMSLVILCSHPNYCCHPFFKD